MFAGNCQCSFHPRTWSCGNCCQARSLSISPGAAPQQFTFVWFSNNSPLVLTFWINWVRGNSIPNYWKCDKSYLKFNNSNLLRQTEGVGGERFISKKNKQKFYFFLCLHNLYSSWETELVLRIISTVASATLVMRREEISVLRWTSMVMAGLQYSHIFLHQFSPQQSFSFHYLKIKVW